MTSNTTTTVTKRQRGRKVAAVLAGGLVLGVGTMATLASWNDTEFAKATFTAGTFNMEGATDGAQSVFSEHTTALTAGTLSFTSIYSNMQPGDVVYAPYALRLDKNTTYNATVAVTAGTFVGSSAGLTYTLFTTAAAGCSSASVPVTTVVPVGTAINAVTGASTFSLAKTAAVGTTAGATTYLCFKVTADPALAQSLSSAPVWNFTATSGVS